MTRRFLTMFLVVSIVALLGTTQRAVSCSRPLQATPAEMFTRSVAVFSGTATSVVLIRPDLIGIADFIPQVEVRWQIDEVYKGKNLERRSATTQYFCGGVFIVVGQPYVFVVGSTDESEGSEGIPQDVIGYLDDQGTKGEWQDTEEFTRLVTEFRKLRDAK